MLLTLDKGARVIKVTTAGGADWFLAGGLPDFTKNLDAKRPTRRVGPFRTDAALAVVRVRHGGIVRAMVAGGSRLAFVQGGLKAEYAADGPGTHHSTGERRTALRRRRLPVVTRRRAAPRR